MAPKRTALSARLVLYFSRENVSDVTNSTVKMENILLSNLIKLKISILKLLKRLEEKDYSLDSVFM